ncbi:DNA polymerase III subunit delta [Orrella marina]|uniref:DNA polymerase III subunit delta n=1 Tax=Orrella marina TaxID=2163011 RepID=A0A2R4XIU5_9BURK|nr:DNA polymerase III subunit delta [Orrella marina]AWB33742.1 DNA polymerase III subunit delta [Orrella marina]
MRRTQPAATPEATLARIKQLPGLIVITGDEPLLVMEAADSLRERAREEGFTDRHSFVMDARSDWQQISLAAGAGSLFGDRQLIEITMPSAKPGKTGGQAISNLAKTHSSSVVQDALLVFKLPELDRQSRETVWCKDLLSNALVLECAAIPRAALPQWIETRLDRQHQTTDRDTLSWMADHVEGNLLAAHQEVLKLGLLYPEGNLSQEQVQTAVMNVARYDVMALRDAAIDGQAARALRILEGLKAEGTPTPLVLWALSDEIRNLARVYEKTRQGLRAQEAMKSLRIFGVREQRLSRLMDRLGSPLVDSLLSHAHDVDRLGKGIPVQGRLDDVWQEMSRLTLRLATSRSR